jgi:hypothetical protein
MKSADDEFKKMGMGIKEEMTNKYVYSLDSPPVIYVIKEYRLSSKFI